MKGTALVNISSPLTKSLISQSLSNPLGKLCLDDLKEALKFKK